jgi:hypothetical protein
MKKYFLLLLLMAALVACTPDSPPAAATPPGATAPPTQAALAPAAATQAGSANQTTPVPASVQTTPAPSPMPRPPFDPAAWMAQPAVPAGLSDRAREIYARGLALGRDPARFSKIGDCQNISSYFLSAFDHPQSYTLGPEYAYLQPTIDYYRGSFSRDSLATKGGFNVAAILSPLRADPEACNANESPLDCELRVWNPSIVIVSMEEGWNARTAEQYTKYMRVILDKIIANGTLPILATKADNVEGDNSINAAVAQLAYEYDLPLWNFYSAAHVLPDQGLSDDGFHLTFARNHFDDPVAMMNAWPWRNLTALQTLDVVRTFLSQP